MKALLFFACSSLLVAGCLNGDFNNQDASVPTPDLAMPKVFDLAGLDLSGLYNCSQLNACEVACTTKACVFMCRNMATPPAVALQVALEDCFNQNCPTGAGMVCDGSSGSLSMACNVCINNTYIPSSMSCSPTQNPSECHKCLADANACTADM